MHQGLKSSHERVALVCRQTSQEDIFTGAFRLIAFKTRRSRVPEERVDGRRRVVIECVWPQIDSGQFSIKRVVGETVIVEADVFADGHDQVACQLLYWREDDKAV